MSAGVMAWDLRLSPSSFETISLPAIAGSSGPPAEIRYAEHFLMPEEADGLLRLLLVETSWQQERAMIYGVLRDSPRLTAWYGDPAARYHYSGMTRDPLPWTPCLLDLRRRVEAAVLHAFNSVLLNLYRNGNDSVGWHSDDEPELGAFPCIASLSLGQTRRFVLKPRRASARAMAPMALALPSGSLLVMRGSVQRDWKHAVPKERNVARPRLNLTFRAVDRLVK